MKCDKCGKKAEYNVANTWFMYKITGEEDSEDYKEISAWDGDIDDFYCKECAKKEGIIPQLLDII